MIRPRGRDMRFGDTLVWGDVRNCNEKTYEG